MAILSFRTSTFARNIYLYGNTKFTEVPTEYVEVVKQYAAKTFTSIQILTALNNDWITKLEYEQTMAYVG